MSQSIDIILPCFNPQKNWVENIISNMTFIQAGLASINLKLILVNDGSSINIQEKDIEKIRNRIPNFEYISYEKNMGKGYAIRKGMSLSQADYAIFTDIDFPFLNEDLVAMAKSLLTAKSDLLIGTRNESYYQRTPNFRKLLSKGLKSMVKFIFNLPCTDTQCGIKGFSKKGKAILLQTTINRYLFDIELLTLASKQKDVKVLTHEVTLKDAIVFTNMKLVYLIQESKNLFLLWLKV